MARLTEEMVVARSKQSDLAAVSKLNCWGAELGDVSLLRRMPNVEVLALSINKISTLADFAHCPRLRELYIRKNNIRDLAEIRHLQSLTGLTSLWLEENPCTDHPNYRMTVLKNLPTLEKLDNVPVHPEELEEALRKGTPIADPDDEYYNQQETYGPYRTQRSADSSPERLAERPEHPEHRRAEQGSDCSENNPEAGYHEATTNGCRRSPPAEQISPTRHRSYSPETEDPRFEHLVASRGQFGDRTWSAEPSSTKEGNLRHTNSTDEPTERRTVAGIRHSQSAQSVKEYAPTNGENHRQQTSPQYNNRHSADLQHYRDSYLDRSDRSESYQQVPQQRCPLECDRESTRESYSRREREGDIASAVMAEHRGFTRRPVTRNSNLLSAVLCLVKELDYPSLEVAEMAVRCRMDELANHQ